MSAKNLLITLMIVVLGVGAWFIYKDRSTAPSESHASHKEIWYCPMHPNYISDKPGDCPICHMRLVKKGADPKAHTSNLPSGYAPVSLTPQQEQIMGVKTVKAVMKPLKRTVRAYGYVTHDLELYESQLEYIEAWREYYTFMSRRPIKDEFRQSWREYYKNPSGRAQSEEFRKAQERLVKAEYVLIHKGLTDPQLEELRKVKFGEPWVQPELLFFEEGAAVLIYAYIYEEDIGFVTVGQKAIVEVPAFNETFEGTVRVVSSVVDPMSRTVLVRIEIPKVKSELYANMYVNVKIESELNDGVEVPRDAVMDTGVRKIIFVKTEHGHFEPREVTTAWEGNGAIQIKTGLKPGEEVAVGANFLIDSESRLQATLSQGGASSAVDHSQHSITEKKK